MPSLFNLTSELQHLYSVLTAESGEHDGEVPDSIVLISDQLEAKEVELAVKLDNYIDLIRRLEGEVKIAEDEEERYGKLAAVRRNAAAQLKQSLKIHLEAIGATKVVTATQRKVWLQSNGQAPLIIDEGYTVDNADNAYVKVVKTLNTKAIGDAIKAGEELPFARYGEKGTHIRIS